MRKILHLSDLHFGRLHPPAIAALQDFLQDKQRAVDVVIVTGDWTQRARHSQFREARAFADSISIPLVSVPGNHDVPLYHFWERFSRPLRKYDQHMSSVTVPHFLDDEVAVAGISTLDTKSVSEGKLKAGELARATQFFSASDKNCVRLLACHHAVYEPDSRLWLRPQHLIPQLHLTEPDLILSGHSHQASVTEVKWGIDHSVLMISAGTGISTRLRAETNSFHLIEIERPQVRVWTYYLGPDGFESLKPEPEVYRLARLTD